MKFLNETMISGKIPKGGRHEFSFFDPSAQDDFGIIEGCNFTLQVIPDLRHRLITDSFLRIQSYGGSFRQ